MISEELLPYLNLCLDAMEKIESGESADRVHNLLLDNLRKIHIREDDTRTMTWEQSFDYYDKILAQREEDANKRGAYDA